MGTAAPAQDPRLTRETGRELIVIMRPEAGLRTSHGAIASASANVNSLADLLKQRPASLRPLFGRSEDRLAQEEKTLKATLGKGVPSLSLFYKVDAKPEELEDLAQKFRLQELVSAAYVKPATQLPGMPGISRELNTMLPSSEQPPLVTPDFTHRQGYLDQVPDVPVQREMESERSPLVKNSAPAGRGFSRHRGLSIR